MEWQAVEDSAPVQDRLRFLSCLSFPPRWELRRDLARRYAGMGVLGSAAAEFVDLEMWEEAVECYRQMQQVGVGASSGEYAVAVVGGGWCDKFWRWLWPCYSCRCCKGWCQVDTSTSAAGSAQASSCAPSSDFVKARSARAAGCKDARQQQWAGLL